MYYPYYKNYYSKPKNTINKKKFFNDQYKKPISFDTVDSFDNKILVENKTIGYASFFQICAAEQVGYFAISDFNISAVFHEGEDIPWGYIIVKVEQGRSVAELTFENKSSLTFYPNEQETIWADETIAVDGQVSKMTLDNHRLKNRKAKKLDRLILITYYKKSGTLKKSFNINGKIFSYVIHQ